MDPFSSSLVGRMHAGEEMQDSELFNKNELTFPSGESLPICWLKANYQHRWILLRFRDEASQRASVHACGLICCQASTDFAIAFGLSPGKQTESLIQYLCFKSLPESPQSSVKLMHFFIVFCLSIHFFPRLCINWSDDWLRGWPSLWASWAKHQCGWDCPLCQRSAQP